MNKMQRLEYIKNFLIEFDYPEEAQKSIISAFESIDKVASEEFEEIVKSYDKSLSLDDFLELEEGKMPPVCKKAGIHEFQGRLIMYLSLVPQLEKYYEESGFPKQMWIDAVKDLKYKMMKCKLIHDIWGSFLRGWHAGFFQLQRFAFGKLEYEVKKAHHNYENGQIKLTEDTDVVYIHIPRTETSLTKEDQDYSFDKAQAFFKKHYFKGMDKIPFMTGSWLLFQKHKEFLNPNSNIYKFMERFEIIDQFEYKDYSSVWRIFNKNFTKWEDLPQETSMQRAYVQMIKNGEKIGGAYGIFYL